MVSGSLAGCRRAGVRCFAAAQVSAPAAYKLNFNQVRSRSEHRAKAIHQLQRILQLTVVEKLRLM
jgi:hypothetical protein